MKKVFNEEKIFKIKTQKQKTEIITAAVMILFYIIILTLPLINYGFDFLDESSVVALIILFAFSASLLIFFIYIIVENVHKLKLIERFRTKYTIADTFLLQKNEHDNKEIFTFWCGEKIGIIKCAPYGRMSTAEKAIGSPFYVCISFSKLEKKYTGEICLSKDHYEPDEKLKQTLISVSKEEYLKKSSELS